MRTVSIDELRRRLAALVDEAGRGERILITRHRRPVASLTRPGFEHVHVSDRSRQATPRPLLDAPTRGAYLKVLAEDRGGSRSTTTGSL